MAGKGSGVKQIVVGVDVPVALPDPYALPFLVDEKWRAGLRSDFENKWCRPLKTAAVGCRTILEDGRPASVTLDIAEREKAELVVIGRRGRGGGAQLLLGSVSHEIVLHSKRPVLLVPRKA